MASDDSGHHHGEARTTASTPTRPTGDHSEGAGKPSTTNVLVVSHDCLLRRADHPRRIQPDLRGVRNGRMAPIVWTGIRTVVIDSVGVPAPSWYRVGTRCRYRGFMVSRRPSTKLSRKWSLRLGRRHRYRRCALEERAGDRYESFHRRWSARWDATRLGILQIDYYLG